MLSELHINELTNIIALNVRHLREIILSMNISALKYKNCKITNLNKKKKEKNK